MTQCPGRLPVTSPIINKEFWLEFIEMYKEHPCLWDRNNDDYYNETLKSLAHGLLLEKMWEIDANADIETVKRKILNFRKYYKETKRRNLEKTQPANSSLSLWFYTKHLEFLNSQDDCMDIENNDDGSNDSNTVNQTPAQRKRRAKVSVTELAKSMNLKTKPNTSYYRRLLPKCDAAVEANLLEGTSTQQDHIVEQSQDSPKGNLENIAAGPSQPLLINTNNSQPLVTDTTQIQEISWNDEPPGKRLLQEASEITIVEKPAEQEVDDDCSTFAAHLKAKMRTFDPQQKCIAQKLISDVMFYASIQELRVTSSIVLDRKA